MELQTKVAGVPHRFPDEGDRKNKLGALHLNQEAVLEPEPTNAFDPNAIRVMIDGVCYGYIPKTMTGWIKQAELKIMYVVSVNPENKWSEIILDQRPTPLVASPI